MIVDVDAIYQALSGLEWYEKPECLLPFVLEARDAALRRLSKESEVRHAWVITSEGDNRKLERMSGMLSATLIVLDVAPSECLQRITNDERRADKAELWKPLIEHWWTQHDNSIRQGRGDKIPTT